jgi:peptidylprolyl isomerase domain and WD repeat-containing protein 1
MPTEEERSLGQELAGSKSLGSVAIIRTNIGEITIKLFPDECPRTVENFAVRLRLPTYVSLMVVMFPSFGM